MLATPDIHLVLVEPLIPQNTGAIARLCACTGATLHLVHPLGFRTDAKSVRRAGLDYWEHVSIREHASWAAFLEAERPEELHFFSSKASRTMYDVTYSPRTFLVFGNESRGLPPQLHSDFRDRFVLIPMRTHLVRSLNLAQSAAIALYEALRQNRQLPG
jgi:tRNA (cytidine/uridine-2'-O-)-methyltransferase